MSLFHGIKYIDTTGVAHGFIDNDGQPQICNQTYLQALAEGDISGHTLWSKQGFNADIGTSQEDIWPVGGTYVPPSAEMQLEVVSSSADDAAAGTGVRTVKIYYLDDAFAEKTETVTLNGTTPVATTATDIYRINYFRVQTCGSGGTAAGDIDLRHLSDTPIYGRISQGFTRARTCFYTVPAGKTLYIYNVMMSSGGVTKPVRFITRAKYDSLGAAATDFFMGYTELVVTDSAIDVPLEVPTSFPAGVDLKVSGVSTQAGCLAAVTLRGWLE